MATTGGLAFVDGAVAYRAAPASWPIPPRVVGCGGVSRESLLRPKPASLRLLRGSASRGRPLNAAVRVVSCSLGGAQPPPRTRSWYGWVIRSSKYHSSLCHVAQRVRGNGNWQEADHPPDDKVLCTLCHDIELRKQQVVPKAVRQQRTHTFGPNTVRFFEALMHRLPALLTHFFLVSHSSSPVIAEALN